MERIKIKKDHPIAKVKWLREKGVKVREED
jgi:hypothetical protein